MEPAAATCLRLLDDAGKGVEDPQLQSAVAQLQSWAVAQPELGAAVSDGEWLQHVFQLVQQHQQQGGGGSGGAGGGGGGKAEKGAGGKRGKGRKGGKGGASSARKPADGGGTRSVLDWLDTTLDSVLLSEKSGIAPDGVVRMRAIADGSVRTSSADAAEFREIHSAPMPAAVFAMQLRACEQTTGCVHLLPTMAPGPDGLAPHPMTEPWAEAGAARAALSHLAANGDPPPPPAHDWPPLSEATSAGVAVVDAATARHATASAALAQFVGELREGAGRWEDLATEARGLSKSPCAPLPPP